MQHNKKAIIQALGKSLGVVTTACASVGIDRSTFYRWLKEDEEFKEAVEDIEDIALDFAESNLHKEIKKGRVAAIIFYLKTKGKKRGYIESHQFDHTSKGESMKSLNIIVDSPETAEVLQKLIDGTKTNPDIQKE